MGLPISGDVTEAGSHELVGERITGPMLTGIRAANSCAYAISKPVEQLVKILLVIQENTYAVSGLLWWLAVQASSTVLSSVEWLMRSPSK